MSHVAFTHTLPPQSITWSDCTCFRACHFEVFLNTGARLKRGETQDKTTVIWFRCHERDRSSGAQRISARVTGVLMTSLSWNGWARIEEAHSFRRVRCNQWVKASSSLREQTFLCCCFFFVGGFFCCFFPVNVEIFTGWNRTHCSLKLSPKVASPAWCYMI